MRTFIVVAVIAAAAAGLTGCGKSGTKVYSDGKNTVAVSGTDAGHMTITGSNGEKVEIGGKQDIGGQMPSYLPMYPGGDVKSSMIGNGKDGMGGLVVFHTKAASADIIAFYKGKATAAGMADTMDMNSGNTTMYVGTNDKTKQSVQVAATKASDGSGTDVQLTWSNKK
jgi:hypothetical protein